MKETTKIKLALTAFIFLYGIAGLIMINGSVLDNVLHSIMVVTSSINFILIRRMVSNKGS